MKDFWQKTIRIYLPFLLVSLTTIIGYSYFRWYFDIRNDFLKIDVVYLDYVLPIIISILVMLLFCKPGIKLLEPFVLKEDDDESDEIQTNNYSIGLLYIGIFTIGISTILAQSYLFESAKKLHRIETVNEIKSTRNFDYYKIKNYSISKDNGSNYFMISYNSSGHKKIEAINFIVAPLIDSTKQYEPTNNKYWAANNYLIRLPKSEKIEDYLTESKIQNKWYWRFYISSKSADYNYFNIVSKSSDRKKYLKIIDRLQKVKSQDSPIILTPVIENWVKNPDEKFALTLNTFIVGNIIFIILLILTEFKKKESTASKDFNHGLNTIVKRFGVSLPIYGIATFVYILMLFRGASFSDIMPETIIKWGAARQTEVLEGEYWRLLTSIFISNGFMQLSFLITIAAVVFSYIKKYMRNITILILFIIFGVVGNLLEIMNYKMLIVTGTYYSILGMYIVALAILLFKKSDNKSLDLATIFNGGLFFIAFMTFNEISWIAHLTVAISAFMITVMLILLSKNRVMLTDGKI